MAYFINFRDILITLYVFMAVSCMAIPGTLHTTEWRTQLQSLAVAIPKYVHPRHESEITEWLAIGDSFSAGISADGPLDEINWRCSRFKMSYPSQMQNSDRMPGNNTSRKFTFGSCTGESMSDVVNNQLTLGEPADGATYPKIGNPQIVTLSVSGNDVGFGDIVNNCLYHWYGYHVSYSHL
jgi:hypothetical protein